MKLSQGQIWKIEKNEYLRIVKLERLSVEYKRLQDLSSRDGTHLKASKKVFCRLIKNGELIGSDS